MNERLQKAYYIIGIIQRVAMVLMTAGLITAMGKMTLVLIKLVTAVNAMSGNIVSMEKTIEALRILMKNSFWF